MVMVVPTDLDVTTIDRNSERLVLTKRCNSGGSSRISSGDNDDAIANGEWAAISACLSVYDVREEEIGGVGERINVSRTVTEIANNSSMTNNGERKALKEKSMSAMTDPTVNASDASIHARSQISLAINRLRSENIEPAPIHRT